MSIALNVRVSEMDDRLRRLEDLLHEFVEHLPKNGSETNAPLEIRVRSLEDKYKMLVARMAK